MVVERRDLTVATYSVVRSIGFGARDTASTPIAIGGPAGPPGPPDRAAAPLPSHAASVNPANNTRPAAPARCTGSRRKAKSEVMWESSVDGAARWEPTNLLL